MKIKIGGKVQQLLPKDDSRNYPVHRNVMMNPKLARKTTYQKMLLEPNALDSDPSQTQLLLVGEMLGR